MALLELLDVEVLLRKYEVKFSGSAVPQMIAQEFFPLGPTNSWACSTMGTISRMLQHHAKNETILEINGVLHLGEEIG